MPGLIGKALNIGAAYARHLNTVRQTFPLSQAEATAALASYLKELSQASFVGFKLSIANWAGRERDAGTKQYLEWIVANADALRTQKLESVNRKQLAPSGVSFEEIIKLLDSWSKLSEVECRARLRAMIAEMDPSEWDELLAHFNKALNNGRIALQQVRDNENKAWGSSIEDRINYGMARLRTGTSDPKYLEEIRDGERVVRWMEGLLAEATNYMRELSQPAPELPSPDHTTRTTDRPSSGEELLKSSLASGNAEQMFAAMEKLLDDAVKSGQVPRDRESALRQIVAKFRDTVIRNKRGEISNEVMIAETKHAFSQLRPLLRTAGEHFVTENTSATSRTRVLLPYVQEIKTHANDGMMAAALKLPGEATRKEVADLVLQSINVIQQLNNLSDDEAVVTFERNEARALGLKARELALLPHLTLAKPFWDCPESYPESNQVFFAGAEQSRKLLAEVCDKKELKFAGEVRAQNYGQARWDSLRSSAIAVFDWQNYKQDGPTNGHEAAHELAAVAYELGLSLALGIPSVVLTKGKQLLPFDIDVEPTKLTGRTKEKNRALLETAIDNALYRQQRTVTESGLDATASWLQLSLATHPQRKVFEKMGWFDEELTNDPIAFRAIILQLLTKWIGKAPVAIYPSWLAAYPDNGDSSAGRLFHVMPFSQQWSASVAQAVAGVCRQSGVTYERGDSSADERIMRRVWNGICTADFVVADLTGLNANVMIELGMAHALGRKTILIEQKHDSNVRRVRNLEKIEVKQYSSVSHLQTMLGKWLG